MDDVNREQQYIGLLKTTFRAHYPDITEQSFQHLIDILAIENFSRDAIIVGQGQIARNIHLLCKGVIKAYFISDTGVTYNKNLFTEGNLVGSTVSLLRRTPSEFTLQTLEDCILITFDYVEFKKLIYKHDDLKNFYIAYLEKQWIIEKEQREVSIVTETASTRYLKLLEKSPDIDKRVPLRDIASHLGITPTQLSRIRKELK
ncbi:cAMP-binding domain of CRP or a regulatory subunit of cAMP-dependent protein kinases [Chitinophaga sp. CF118]|uniref:Crp/Fnr family transcriptional regulator n=1 Tax=Chitinophaga sp. CF118 TaxID=1884367 RepID=UPI0008E0B8F3|nr:Crp/Fnr family transcriptional regulator [Chitinophaga sp. CF118]SFE61811.1 cAMP-binding domain of CRP or a regulatory subunit of cAMP-dependent protein kinases [Chitinophaga sp. CF118]